MNTLSISSIDNSRCELIEFKRLAHEYCEIINQFGYKVKPHRDWKVLHFEKCALPQKKRAILFLDANIEILKECIASGENPRNSARLLWRILRKIKATPEADIFDKMLETDVVEVYLDDHTQIFRNLEFFNYTSFTIDELLCGPWHKLYKRDWIPTLRMMRMAVKIFAGRLNSTSAWNVPTHVFYEVGSEETLKQTIELKYLSPLKSNGKMMGAICTSAASRC
ncbi:MAG: hypothetical protein H7177_15170 [Rhizobacter sp.]|nr:hypothetical protein [Bacteriovorax sp.]